MKTIKKFGKVFVSKRFLQAASSKLKAPLNCSLQFSTDPSHFAVFWMRLSLDPEQKCCFLCCAQLFLSLKIMCR